MQILIKPLLNVPKLYNSKYGLLKCSEITFSKMSKIIVKVSNIISNNRWIKN